MNFVAHYFIPQPHCFGRIHYWLSVSICCLQSLLQSPADAPLIFTAQLSVPTKLHLKAKIWNIIINIEPPKHFNLGIFKFNHIEYPMILFWYNIIFLYIILK